MKNEQKNQFKCFSDKSMKKNLIFFAIALVSIVCYCFAPFITGTKKMTGTTKSESLSFFNDLFFKSEYALITLVGVVTIVAVIAMFVAAVLGKKRERLFFTYAAAISGIVSLACAAYKASELENSLGAVLGGYEVSIGFGLWIAVIGLSICAITAGSLLEKFSQFLYKFGKKNFVVILIAIISIYFYCFKPYMSVSGMGVFSFKEIGGSLLFTDIFLKEGFELISFAGIATILAVVAVIVTAICKMKKGNIISAYVAAAAGVASLVFVMTKSKELARAAGESLETFSAGSAWGLWVAVISLFICAGASSFPSDEKKADRVIDIIIYFVMALVIFCALYPIWYIVVASFSSNDAVASGQVVWWLKDFTLESYKNVVSMSGIWTSYGNTLFYSFFGTAVNMFLTVTCAYALSKKWLFGRKFFTLFIMLSMWFGAGMIANFINYRELGLIDNRWGMLLIGAVSAYNVILMRSFFESIPTALDESARLDGANEFTILWKIYLPLSTAALMTISLYYFVSHWNSYFWSMILLQDEAKLPLQVLLQKLVVKMDAMNNAGGAMDYTVVSRETVVYATMVVAVLPMLIIYPFVQKFFVKGVMLGAVKE